MTRLSEWLQRIDREGAELDPEDILSLFIKWTKRERQKKKRILLLI